MAILSGSWLLDAVLVLAPLIYWYIVRNNSYWKNLKVPYMKPYPIVGNFGGVVTGRQHVMDPELDCYFEAGDEPFMGMFGFGGIPILVVKDPELVGRVISTDFSSFYCRTLTADARIDKMMTLSLFGSKGPVWKALRAKLTPAFTTGKMKRMFHLIEAVGEDLSRCLGKCADKGDAVDVRDLMSRYTTDAVTSIFMGIDCGTLKGDDAPLRQYLRRLFGEDWIGFTKQMLSVCLPKLMVLLGIEVRSKEDVDYMKNNVIQLVEERKRKGIVRGDIVELLTRLKEEQHLSDDEDSTRSRKSSEAEEQLKFDDDVITSQIILFLIAGFETSASTITFALYELAMNQELQERVRKHVRQALARHGGKLSYEALQEMTMLTDVINETLRLHPPVRLLDRKAVKEYQIPGTDIILPKGTCVGISVVGLHTDPRYWKEPHRFIPERFSDGSAKSRPNYTFLPFGEGPRMCIGMRVAYMQVKVGLVHILNKFEIRPSSRTPVPVSFDRAKFITQPKGELPLKFNRIQAQ